MLRRTTLLGFLLVLSLGGCADPDPSDAGPGAMDAGEGDAGAGDAGPGDAGAEDAGPSFACMLYDPPDCPMRDDATCTCSGCGMDGRCTIEDDCTCPECDDAEFLCLDDGCVDDGLCSPISENCRCADCRAHPMCVGR